MASIRSSLRTRNPLPEGALSVGAGIAIAGISQYGFLAVAAHGLGPSRYAPLATFWSLLFICGPGFFLPLEQEVSRALAARRAHGQGGRPLVLRAATAGALLAAVLAVTAAALAGPIDDRLFGGDRVFGWALVAGLVAYAVAHLTRGTLAGNGRFPAYGLLLGSEGALRVVFGAALAVAGIRTGGAFGFAVVVATGFAVVLALAGRRGLLLPGPHSSMQELSRALGFLLVSSLLTQFLLNVGTVAVQLLATPAQKTAAGQFLTARVLAYVPLFLFQAVQFTLLPKLSALAARGRGEEFRAFLGRLLLLVTALGAVSVAGFGLLGPLASRLLFGGGFQLGHADYALLAAGSAAYMLAQAINQALVALSGYARAAAGWVAGGAVFVLVTLAGGELFRRVELGLLGGGIAAVAVMAALLPRLLRARAAVATEVLTTGEPPAAKV